MDSFEINPENITPRRNQDVDPSTLRDGSDRKSNSRPRMRVDYDDTIRPLDRNYSERFASSEQRTESTPTHYSIRSASPVQPAEPQPEIHQAYSQPSVQPAEPVAEQPRPIAEPQPASQQQQKSDAVREHPNVATLARFFADGRLRIFIGVLLILAAAYMLVASIAYLTSGTADQSIVANSTMSQISDGPHDVENTAGWFGAFLSNLLMYRWLGLGGFIIIFYICALGISLVRLHHFRFWQLTFKSLVAAIAVSIIAGFTTYSLVSPTLWGGQHGYWVNHGIMSAASFWGGAAVSILMATALILIFISPIRRGLSFLKMLIANRRDALAERYRSSMAAAKAAVSKEQDSKEHQMTQPELQQHPAPEPQPAPAAPQPAAPAPEEHADEIKEEHPASPRPISVSVTLPESENQISAPISTDSQPKIKDNVDMPAAVVSTDPEPTDNLSVQPSEKPLTEQSAETQRPKAVFSLTDIEPAPHSSGSSTLNDRFTSSFDSEKTDQPDPEQPDPDSSGMPSIAVTEAPRIEPAVEMPSDSGQKTVEDVLNSEAYDPRADLSRYRFPGIDLLHHRESNYVLSAEEQEENNNRIISTLDAYGIKIESIKATVGPTITLYEIVPQTGTRISSIKRLGDDMALSLSAIGIRIIAPIPGKGTIGMEVPNKKPQIVGIRSILSSRAFQESNAALPIALGTTIDNEVYVADLAKMPHLLVAGATGMGKSVGLNTIIASLLYKKHPAELKFVLVDPKMVEFSLYKCLERHFLAKLPDEEEPIITDPQKVVATLNSLCLEMDNRYALLSKAGMRGIKEYNQKFMSRRLSPEKGHRYLPYIVVVIDEFGDLILTAGKEVENPISRIAAKARAVGIHMILATQRPSVNVITGVIKANFPGRMAFRVTQMNDSRTILDRPGAEQLIGRGDMLISRDGVIDRVQCAFIDTDEVEAVCDCISEQMGYPTSYELPEEPAPQGDGAARGALTDRDPMFADAGRAVIETGMGSASMLQRRFNIGYPRAGKLIDQLEAAGVVGTSTGAGKPRPVLLDSYSFERMLEG